MANPKYLMQKIYLGGNSVIVWDRFVNSATGTPVTDATIEGNVSTLDGSEIAAFTLTYQEDIEKYTGAVDTTVTSSSGAALMIEGEEYIVTVTATKGSAIGTKKRRVIAKYDSFD